MSDCRCGASLPKGRRVWCSKPCQRRHWKLDNPTKNAESVLKSQRTKAGIVGATGERKAGRCNICARYRAALHLDHNHKTGQRRGWLCGSCNRALGLLQEDLDVLAVATHYLEYYAKNH